ncbi:MAG: nitrous oxide reductase accessory protein NosL [Capnocytophaga sp.]|nr:nitrous oxide reductase accessory protein NosL [Capnocytophaga sp.]
MKSITSLLGIFTLLAFTSCEVAPQPIEYGTDMCHFCSMSIVDKTHAAQIVTQKGRAYKYDAAECMIQDIQAKDYGKIALFLVTDYTHPAKLIDAAEATFLVSEEIKSPMGANLSAFEKKEEAQKYEGQLFTWETIQKRFDN